MKLLFNDGNQHVGADSRPDLSLHGALACAEKVLDAQVLLDPFEEEFDLPAVFVQGCDGDGTQTGVVGKEDQRFFGAGVGKPNAPNVFRIVLDGIKALERNTLIGDHPCASIRWGRLDASGPKLVFCSGDKKGARLMKAIKPLDQTIVKKRGTNYQKISVENIGHKFGENDLGGLQTYMLYPNFSGLNERIKYDQQSIGFSYTPGCH